MYCAPDIWVGSSLPTRSAILDSSLAVTRSWWLVSSYFATRFLNVRSSKMLTRFLVMCCSQILTRYRSMGYCFSWTLSHKSLCCTFLEHSSGMVSFSRMVLFNELCFYGIVVNFAHMLCFFLSILILLGPSGCYFPRGALMQVGFLLRTGQLLHHGFLFMHGSLKSDGLLFCHGSLIFAGLLFSCGSLLSNGFLVWCWSTTLHFEAGLPGS